MRILNILFNHKRSVNPRQYGGVEQSFIDYIEYFLKNGCKAWAVVKPGVPYADKLKDVVGGDNLYEINALGHGDVLTMLRLRMLVRKFKPDVILCHSGRAVYMAKWASVFLNIPVVAVSHGSSFKGVLRADYIMSVNSSFRDQIAKMKGDGGDEKVFVVPNMLKVPEGFDGNFGKDNYNARRKRIGKVSDGGELVVGSMGRMSSEKNYDKLIEAISLLARDGFNVRLMLGGDGDMMEGLKQLARDLKVDDRVEFLGWIDGERKKEFFEKIDVFCLPSVVETFGMVLLEAMINHTPMIAANSWGPRDIIDDCKNGLMIDVENRDKVPLNLVSAFKKLLGDMELADKMVEKAFDKFVNEYTMDKVGSRVVEILTGIVCKNKN